MANAQKSEYNKLTDFERYVILDKGTERPYTGKYTDHKEKGTYVCKQCEAPLYKSNSKFDSHCGWPSFDDEIKGAVTRVPDADGRRTEIICTNCKGHLGHVFLGEGFTRKNTRHCVNSVSLIFKPKKVENKIAYFASGCFWGVEYHFAKAKGVVDTEVGYMGGHVKNPTYKEVCTGRTGHKEVIRVEYDPALTDYETLGKLFFETHDPGQEDGQGPDKGDQYLSVIYYLDEEQKQISEKLMDELRDKGYKVVTQLTEAPEFYAAEDYHQNYYENKGSTPYCHFYTKKFD